VILLDFWAYCCINCIHVIPDLKWLEEKFEEMPLIIIGVHAPKFENEKNVDNVRAAVLKYKIKHPVVLDNERKLLSKYYITSWPSFVLINTTGQYLATVSGEGKKKQLFWYILAALEEGRQTKTIAAKRTEIIPDRREKTQLEFPGKIDITPKGDRLFVSDSGHNRILHIKIKKPDIGEIVATIGDGEAGLEDGSYTSAKFNMPQGVAYYNDKLYVADTENHAIREIDLDKKQVTTIAGNGHQGYQRKYSGCARDASLSSPWDIAVRDGVLYIAMAGYHQIWRLILGNKTIENFIGNGAEGIMDGGYKRASLAQPSGISINGKKIYFADSDASALRYAEFTTRKVKTFIGKGLFVFGSKDGVFNEAKLQRPLGLDAVREKLYIADSYNHAIRIADFSTREIKSIIHSPHKRACLIDNKECEALPLYEPNDVMFFDEKLYIADTNNHLIRVFDLNTRELKDVVLN
jgi:thiol-disulfide isomerase/thioredoxin